MQRAVCVSEWVSLPAVGFGVCEQVVEYVGGLLVVCVLWVWLGLCV